jgi:hypothetical protein
MAALNRWLHSIVFFSIVRGLFGCRLLNCIKRLNVIKKMVNQINQISQEDVGLIYRSLSQKYESFLRACFVLPAYKSSILNNEYLDKVSIPFDPNILLE